MRRINWLVVGWLALAVIGCARVSATSLAAVTDGKAHPDQYVRATVTDVRTTTQLVIELSDGHTQVWASGFTPAPTRGTEVWTSVRGAPTTDDVVGPVYPTAGLLKAPDSGLTDTGVLGVLVGIVAAFALLVPAVSAILLGGTRNRRCDSCGAGLEEAWQTCPTCGARARRTAAPADTPIGAAPTGATVVTQRPASEETTAAMPITRAAAPASTPPSEPPIGPAPSAGTRLFRRDE